ncbi:MAG: hypothetical protein ACLUE1_04080 [Adlercreutzia equolifaciens]
MASPSYLLQGQPCSHLGGRPARSGRLRAHTRAGELADSAPWKAGTYDRGDGPQRPYTMTVTFSDDAITAIDTSASQESLGVRP